jgi:hypothetical protein
MTMYRILPDEILSPDLVERSFFEEHLALILCVAAVVAVTVVLIVLLKKRNRRK